MKSEQDKAGQLPAGWVAVPIEPTDEMLMEAKRGYERASQSLASFFADRRAYAAMLAALPPLPADQGEQQ